MNQLVTLLKIIIKMSQDKMKCTKVLNLAAVLSSFFSSDVISRDVQDDY